MTLAAIVGKEKIMDVAQDSFISSTYWTESIGPAAAIATINKLKKNNVPIHLNKIGNVIKKRWRKLADSHNLKIKITGIPPLPTFVFDYKDSQELITLFAQEMLKRGFLASGHVSCSYSHKEEHVRKYLDNADDVFGIIKKAIKNNNVKQLLKGPVAQVGFKRLT